ncbi:hemicentin-1-like isoform X4 [Acropora millepora]|uniref:hemicentin-1-like isoform X4 n=1 Tax=Acropora millepora TaxID=45264 RepID=UPI001CF21452|nr:hemicentin-1-like isoform X4 [Acropora millepora]
MPELFQSICERQMELCKMKLISCMLYLLHSVVLLDGFQWSHRQQASHVISVEAGSDVSLPCEYELTPQEQQEADVFHLLTWTREEPHFSDRWTGLAINSTLSESKVIYDDPQRIFIADGTLTVKNITVKDRTRYQCAFQSSFFTTPSIINLDVKYPPEIMLKPLSQDIVEGNDVRLLCNASGNPQPKITWMRQGNSDVLSSSETLLLRNLVSKDDGSVYMCRVENYLGFKQASVTITIQYPPEIMLKPLSQDIVEGNDVRLLCNASGNPQPKITWTRQGNSDVLSSSETLLLRNLVSKDDGSVYMCRVENYLGFKQASVTITIQYKPKDTQVTISSGEVKLGDRVDITCWAHANPSPEYKFYYNNKLIRWSSKGLLSLTSVNTEDQGMYQCVPVNYLGDGSEASVTVTLSTGDKAFPVWVYAAIASGVLFLLLIAAGIALCRARKKWKAADDGTKTAQPKESTISRPRDAKEAHVGPGDFCGDHNGSIEIPHLNGALSFSDIRSSQEFPGLKGAFSANDLRRSEMPTIRGALSENNLRMGEVAGLKNTLTDDKSMGQFQTAFSRLDEAYPMNSVMHLITGAEEAVSQL